MIARRTLLAAAGAALLPMPALGQAPRRVVVLTPGAAQWMPELFRAELAQRGFRDGVEIRLEVVSAERRLEQLSALAAEAAGTGPALIIAVNTPAALAAARATTTIPIVAVPVGDPLGSGFAASIARPGGNITGVANLSPDITAKRITLLKEIVPGARRIALFSHPDDPVVVPQLRDVEASAAAMGIEHRVFAMRDEAGLRGAIAEAKAWDAHGIVRLAGQAFSIGPATGRLSTEAGLPSMLTQRADIAAGGLVSYFPESRELWQRAAAQAASLLKGADPADTPFELPTRFELFVSLRAAAALRLTVPPSILLRADEVIE